MVCKYTVIDSREDNIKFNITYDVYDKRHVDASALRDVISLSKLLHISIKGDDAYVSIVDIGTPYFIIKNNDLYILTKFDFNLPTTKKIEADIERDSYLLCKYFNKNRKITRIYANQYYMTKDINNELLTTKNRIEIEIAEKAMQACHDWIHWN